MLSRLVAATAVASATLFTLAPVADAHTAPLTRIHHAVRVVRAQLGDPYVYGAAGPAAFDCSGLFINSFGRAGVWLPRTSDAQYRYVRHIRLAALRRGDFVYYHDMAVMCSTSPCSPVGPTGIRSSSRRPTPAPTSGIT